jgi:hypothetical protein
VGRNKPLRLYELLSAESETADINRKAVNIWERALNVYEHRKFREALQLFFALVKRFPEDNVAKLYARRCKNFIKDPPQQDWDAVNNLKEKKKQDKKKLSVLLNLAAQKTPVSLKSVITNLWRNIALLRPAGPRIAGYAPPAMVSPYLPHLCLLPPAPKTWRFLRWAAGRISWSPTTAFGGSCLIPAAGRAKWDKSGNREC